MTPERLATMKATAESWSDANPFKASLLKRLSELGGLHRPPSTADRRTEREQARVDHAREVAESKVAGGLPF